MSTANAAPGHSYGQPVRNLVLLSLLTLNLYQLYWFYRNWKHLKSHTGADIRPGLRTVGLLIPIVSFFLIYDQFDDIHDLSTGRGIAALGVRYSPMGLMLAYVLINALWMVPGRVSLLGVLAFIPLVYVQRALNDYWQHEQPDRAMRRRFSGGEIGVLTIGGIFTALAVIVTVAPEPEPEEDFRSFLQGFPTEGRIVQVGSEVEGVLTADDAGNQHLHRENPWDTTYAQAWALEGQRGAPVTIDLLSDAFDASLLVVGPGLAEVLQDDDGAGGCDSRVSLVFPDDSTYRVIVSTVEVRKGGPFTLRVTETPGPKTLGSCGG